MKVCGIKPKNIAPDGVILEEVKNHIKKTKFPKKVELSRIIVTRKYYDDKIKDMEKLIESSEKEVTELLDKTINLKSECAHVMNSLSDLF